MMKILRRPARAQRIRIGDRELLTRGLSNSFWGDVYHRSLTASWPVFFLGYAVFFVTLNALFAALFWLGEAPIANARPDFFADLFYFSIETLATVGYGDMHPRTDYAHLVATLEIFIGMSSLAVFTGLIFTRFSRPRARLVFARDMVLGSHDGQRMLMTRLANARQSFVSEARAEIWYFYDEETRDGRRFRRFAPLALRQHRNPAFALSWLLLHKVDEASPIFGKSAADLEAADAYFIVTFHGFDDASGQQVNIRHSYSYKDVRVGHVFVDILAQGENGSPFIDYRKFHDTIEEASIELDDETAPDDAEEV